MYQTVLGRETYFSTVGKRLSPLFPLPVDAESKLNPWEEFAQVLLFRKTS